ncbi:amylo-alpha-1,6-glucosidase [Ramlibacter rhizophilus]|uniref:Glycogen debranching protein n=1 Tax=Ramlibacter rhizophilus TaxID=1781167 RepID=A0A4Z0C1U8_9BURK|nr:amylo-alpha-1,6-glucosidase [Ramlibacter rhizophilus]TFZ04794.1 glycogen debranching protein [Ramlibacter rhizophilus]
MPSPPRRDTPPTPERTAREWLVTNGIGGYASGSVEGACLRRYHGVLVAALGGALGRTVMLSQLVDHLRLPDGRELRLASEERADGQAHGPDVQAEFGLERGLPVWRFTAGDVVLEKRVLMPHGQNTVHISYRLQGGAAQLVLRPRLQMRAHEAPVTEAAAAPYEVLRQGAGHEIRSQGRGDLPPLRLLLHGTGGFQADGGPPRDFFFRIESERGYADRGPLWSPGTFLVALSDLADCTLVASTEPWETMLALQPAEARAAEQARRDRLVAQAHPAARSAMAAELVLAADPFIIAPVARRHDAALAQAEGDAARTVIAGYHWFTDWGRDTMISLEGLTLLTGRHEEAGSILRTFLHYVRDGLIPNMFPEGEHEGLYHTADATLWFFHAVDRYLAHTGDTALLRKALPVFRSIVEHHLRGTRFGIGVDPADGLLRQGAEGYQLTWMDAKVDGWVVTPRRGKAVELNALFYNALCLMRGWLDAAGDAPGAAGMQAHAQRLAESFNRRFWNAQAGCLFDVVDGEGGDDPGIRPNMLLAISLPHPVLDASRWAGVLEVARRELLTPVGLRSLAPSHPDYQPRYDGDLRARDAAYHQGTVWGWLAGPFADAWLKQPGSDAAVLDGLREGFARHLREAGVGSISEIFDAEAPHVPRGCIAQAWSVAEALRLLVRLDAAATPPSPSSSGSAPRGS